MSEPKDQAIKLFGRTIPVLDIPARSGESSIAQASSSSDVADDGADQNRASSAHSCNSNNSGGEESEINQDTVGEKLIEEKKKDRDLVHTLDEVADLDSTTGSGDESVNPSAEKEATSLKTSWTEEQSENSQEKTLKKPDKILSCPRCNSMDTKFCYYNNYNVNQPRHFCKNCQRYWTAGGAMRNVPVGAGRRKNKSTASHHRQMTAPEAALPNPQSDVPNGIHHPSLSCNGADLKFGTNTRLCESMTSILNIADKTLNNDTRNRFNRPEEPRIVVPHAGEEKGNGHPISSVMSTDPTEGATINKSQEQIVQNFQSFPPQVPYFPGAPWPLSWNPAQWSSPAPPTTFFPPLGFTVPFYPAPAYWGCTMSGMWNIPWIVQPSSPHSSASNSGPDSPTLGKHSREENSVKSNDIAGEDEHNKESNKEKNLWVPKTLRIDDLGEAAKSSIWTTLGIKSNEADSIQGEGIFKAFPSKVDEKDHVVPNSKVLQANPAALSRSINFRETS